MENLYWKVVWAPKSLPTLRSGLSWKIELLSFHRQENRGRGRRNDLGKL